MKKYSLFFFFVFSSLFIFAQQSKIDSLQRLLSNAKEDTNKVLLLIKLADGVRSNDPDKALAYANEAKGLSEKNNYKKGIGTAWLNIGAANHVKGNYDSAIVCYRKAIGIFKQINYIKN